MSRSFSVSLVVHFYNLIYLLIVFFCCIEHTYVMCYHPYTTNKLIDSVVCSGYGEMAVASILTLTLNLNLTLTLTSTLTLSSLISCVCSGYGEMAVASILGSNIFNLLIGIGKS